MPKSGDFRLTFGRYNGQTLDEIAQSDEGLKWLDWMVGIAYSSDLKLALKIYLSQPDLQRRIDLLIDDDHD